MISVSAFSASAERFSPGRSSSLEAASIKRSDFWPNI